MPLFKPTDQPRRGEFKPRRRASINRLEIPDNIRRDVILERDPCYCGNVRQLFDNVRAGRVEQATSVAIREWLIMASLRRNHVSLAEARRLARA